MSNWLKIKSGNYTKLSQALGLDLELNYAVKGPILFILFPSLPTLPSMVSTLSQVWLPLVVTRWHPIILSALWGYHLYLVGERTCLDQYSEFRVYWMLLRTMATHEQYCSLGNNVLVGWSQCRIPGKEQYQKIYRYYVYTRYQIPYDTVPVF